MSNANNNEVRFFVLSRTEILTRPPSWFGGGDGTTPGREGKGEGSGRDLHSPQANFLDPPLTASQEYDAVNFKFAFKRDATGEEREDK